MILPTPAEAAPNVASMRNDPEVEAIAIEVTRQHEESEGRKPISVEEENCGWDITSLKDGQVARYIEVKGRASDGAVALIVHLVRWAAGDETVIHDEVDEQSIEAGVVLSRWFGHEARRIYGMLDESDVETQQRDLADLIRRMGGSVTARDLQQAKREIKNAGAAEEALDGLVKAGIGCWEDVPTTAKGGRPTRRFRLPTASTVYGTPTNAGKNEGCVDVDTVDDRDDGDGWEEV